MFLGGDFLISKGDWAARSIAYVPSASHEDVDRIPQLLAESDEAWTFGWSQVDWSAEISNARQARSPRANSLNRWFDWRINLADFAALCDQANKIAASYESQSRISVLSGVWFLDLASSRSSHFHWLDRAERFVQFVRELPVDDGNVVGAVAKLRTVIDRCRRRIADFTRQFVGLVVTLRSEAFRRCVFAAEVIWFINHGNHPPERSLVTWGLKKLCGTLVAGGAPAS